MIFIVYRDKAENRLKQISLSFYSKGQSNLIDK